MKMILLACAIALASIPAVARDKVIPPAATAAQTTPLAGMSEQTVQVTAIEPVTEQASQQADEQAIRAEADVPAESVAPAAPDTPAMHAAPVPTRPSGFPATFGGMAHPAPVKSNGDR